MKRRTEGVTPRLRKGLAYIVTTAVTAGVVWLAVELGSRPNRETEEYLKSPSVLSERLQKSLHDGAADDQTVSETPLVKEARAFASYLSPVKPVTTPATVQAEAAVGTMEPVVAGVAKVAPPASSPKFELHGISYHALRPEESMALVWEPDVGRRWVRLGAQLGHITIEQIDHESILYSDGHTSHEMALKLSETSTTFAKDSGQKSPSKSLASGQKRASGASPAQHARSGSSPHTAANSGPSLVAGAPPGGAVVGLTRQRSVLKTTRRMQ